MGSLFDIIMYILFFAGLIMSLSAWLSDIRFGNKGFVWYYYIPAAVLSLAFGLAAPHIFVWWLYEISVGSSAMGWVIIICFPLLVLGSLLGLFFAFFRKEKFSSLFFWSLALTCLFGLSFVILSLSGF